MVVTAFVLRPCPSIDLTRLDWRHVELLAVVGLSLWRLSDSVLVDNYDSSCSKTRVFVYLLASMRLCVHVKVKRKHRVAQSEK